MSKGTPFTKKAIIDIHISSNNFPADGSQVPCANEIGIL